PRAEDVDGTDPEERGSHSGADGSRRGIHQSRFDSEDGRKPGRLLRLAAGSQGEIRSGDEVSWNRSEVCAAFFHSATGDTNGAVSGRQAHEVPAASQEARG